MNWLELLRAEVAASTVTAAAARIGVSRSALSQVLNGCGPYGTGRASVATIAEKTLARLSAVTCPFLSEFHGKATTIALVRCREVSNRSRPPINSARELRHWRACRSCPYSPIKLNEGVAR